MAEQANNLERVYIIPLRRAWVNVPEFKRARKAVMTIKHFIARHMKVKDRNLDNVKLDVYLNNEVWFRGKKSPPSKIKVKAIRDGEIVKVQFAETPKYVNFLKLRNSKLHKKVENKVEHKAIEQPKEQKTEDEKKEEAEKGKAVEQQGMKQADAAKKAEKHVTKVKEQKIQRMALKK